MVSVAKLICVCAISLTLYLIFCKVDYFVALRAFLLVTMFCFFSNSIYSTEAPLNKKAMSINFHQDYALLDERLTNLERVLANNSFQDAKTKLDGWVLNMIAAIIMIRLCFFMTILGSFKPGNNFLIFISFFPEIFLLPCWIWINNLIQWFQKIRKYRIYSINVSH